MDGINNGFLCGKEWPAATLCFPFCPCGLGIHDIKNIILDLGSGLLRVFSAFLSGYSWCSLGHFTDEK